MKKLHWWNPGVDMMGALACVYWADALFKRSPGSPSPWTDFGALLVLAGLFCMNVNDAIEQIKLRWNKNS